jgi:flagellar biosynthetic protein FliR
MPSLNVFAVGFPAKVLVGLLVLAASLPFVGSWAGDQLQGSVASALQMLRAG